MPTRSIATFALLAVLSGCASVTTFTEQHPRATALIAGSLITTIALRSGRRDGEPARVTIPTNPCKTAEACK